MHLRHYRNARPWLRRACWRGFPANGQSRFDHLGLAPGQVNLSGRPAGDRLRVPAFDYLAPPESNQIPDLKAGNRNVDIEFDAQARSRIGPAEGSGPGVEAELSRSGSGIWMVSELFTRSIDWASNDAPLTLAMPVPDAEG